MKETMKQKLMSVRDFVLTHGKIVFPLLLIAAVAVTVVFALHAGKDKTDDVAGTPATTEVTNVSDGNVLEETVLSVPDVPLEKDAYEAVNHLMRLYYQAAADGDVDTIVSIKSSVDDMERIRIVELGKYIESYPTVEVYTKPGPEENSYIVIVYTHTVMSYYPEDYYPGYASFYVCTREDGSLYINQDATDEPVLEYIRQIMLQDDVVELHNKIEVEYKEICLNKPELFNYIAEVEKEVKKSVGEILASQAQDVSGGDVSDSDVSSGDAGNVVVPPETPVITGPAYATATTTVNVRSSDSETADKLGKVASGTKVEVLEQKPNGWTKIVYEGKEGYIKSEFLELTESAAGVTVIGTVTTMTNVNVRISPNQTSEKLGVVAGGTTLDLVEVLDDWCKIIYDGQIGYVKAEFVQ